MVRGLEVREDGPDQTWSLLLRITLIASDPLCHDQGKEGGAKI